MVVDARSFATIYHRHIIFFFKFFDCVLYPIRCGLPVDGRSVHHGATAPGRALLDQDDALTRLRGSKGCRQARDAAADNQGVAEGILMFVAIAVCLGRGGPQTGGAADYRLEYMFPEGARMDERLVVESGGQETRPEVVDPSDIEGERRPGILAVCNQTVIKRLHRGALVRLEMRSLADLHQGIGFFGA